MESEEFEQIPWANLVADHTDGIDKRVYLAAGLVGLLVVAVFGVRLLGGGSQPVPPVQSIAPTPTSIVPEVQAVPADPTPMVIAEADLMAEAPVEMSAEDRLVEVTAEWFVADWFTRDGSEETVRSIKAALAPEVMISPLPHEALDEPVTFVEWARVIETEFMGDGRINVTVAYRAIRESGDGFVRDPVKIVVVELVRGGDEVRVVSLPET